MKLSDAFNGDYSSLELIVRSININFSRRAQLLEKCSYLNEYSILICYVKSAIANGLNRRNAIIQAVDRCIKENVMKDYLISKKDEVFSMLDFQWNLDDAKAAWHDEGFEQGKVEGENRLSRLISALIADGKTNDIESVAVNPLRRNELYKIYNI